MEWAEAKEKKLQWMKTGNQETKTAGKKCEMIG